MAAVQLHKSVHSSPPKYHVSLGSGHGEEEQYQCHCRRWPKAPFTIGRAAKSEPIIRAAPPEWFSPPIEFRSISQREHSQDAFGHGPSQLPLLLRRPWRLPRRRVSAVICVARVLYRLRPFWDSSFTRCSAHVGLANPVTTRVTL